MLHEIASLAGVARGYLRQDGVPVETSDASVRAVLAGLGLDTSTSALMRETCEALRRHRNGPLPQLVIARPGEAINASVRSAASEAEWRLTGESGGVREGRSKLTSVAGRMVLPLPPQRMGYYRLDALGATATMIVAPERCWRPDFLDDHGRAWGVAAQVYGLSSAHDLGVGGFAEAGALARGAAEVGASFLGLSPLHALFAADRGKHSPYSPSNRLLLEPMYIDPRDAPYFEGSAAHQLLQTSEFAARAEAVRGQRLVDYHETWAVKRALLDALWRDFKARGGDAGFEAFRREGGEPLQSHALFEALSERFAAEGRCWIGEWPEEFRELASPATQAALQSESERVNFHAWLQWLADLQLAAAAARARDAGMEIGLYRDLAVGADAAGSEVWRQPDAYAPTLAIGAPPDPLGPFGQNWGLPPLHPLRLESDGLLQFRRLVAANMRHAGAIRIDHGFQLERLFLIPPGADPCDGAYVDYPFEGLLACLRIESHRAKSLVIAEDLGTSPEGFSEAIMRSGVMSYRLLFFERDDHNGFLPPRDYPEDALAAVTTHDLPTLAGWWRGVDIDMRSAFGHADAHQSDQQRRQRRRERAELREALAQEAVILAEPAEAPTLPVFRYLARTPSKLLALQTEDLAQDVHQANVPGPARGYPNWRRRLPMDVETLCEPGGLLARGAVAMAEEGRGLRRETARLAAPPPRATYRLQFRAEFTFDDAARIAPYLAALGVSHVYASPIQTARPGSPHGYDIVDHTRINPELGGEAGFLRFSKALRENGLKLLLDIVPNHMGVGGADNGWWLSTLEWGELSPHAHVFDIDWERLGAHRKLVLPFLGKPYGAALREGELQLRFDADEGSFSVWHWEHRFPINPLDYRYPIEWAQVAGGAGAEMRPLLTISEELRDLVDAPRPASREGRVELCERLKERLARAARRSGRIRDAIDKAVSYANGDVSAPESFGPLHRLLDRQSYRLAYWRVATSEVNYRRFFDINALAGVRVEDEAVFETTHALILRLVEDDLVHGLRIDHVDGLADPQQYLERLQARVGPGFYIAVEKILEPGEKLRPWPIAGTTGYEALNQLDGLFLDAQSQPAIDDAYADVVARSDDPTLNGDYETQLRRTKLELLTTSFGSELESLVSDVKRAADADIVTSDITTTALRRALAEIVASLPVYRTYLTDREAEAADRLLIEQAVAEAKAHSVLEDATAHDFAAALLLAPPDAERSPTSQTMLERIRRRFQQLSGPVMAKSLEDTLFYRYARYVAINEVGGDPGRFGVTTEEFHAMNAERAAHWPASLLATATHDMKRGEDLRARLLALSHAPQTWLRFVEAAQADRGDGTPDANDRYMLLQTLIGAWPAAPDGSPLEPDDAFRDRIFAYAQKALRESKRRSTWTLPDQPYEEATQAWLQATMDADALRIALADEMPRLAQAGIAVGLARTTLKLTAPGAPDLYQGCEFTDFSLVDPDNRRPVDYKARETSLRGAAIRGADELKQAIVAALLADRAAFPQLYARGNYEPVEAPRGWIAFRRHWGGQAMFVGARYAPFAMAEPERDWLAGTEKWRNLLSGAAFATQGAGAAPPAFVLRTRI